MKNIFSPRNFCSEICLGKKKFDLEIFVGLKKIWVKKNFDRKNFFVNFFFGMDHLVGLNLGWIPKISFLGNLEVV